MEGESGPMTSREELKLKKLFDSKKVGKLLPLYMRMDKVVRELGRCINLVR